MMLFLLWSLAVFFAAVHVATLGMAWLRCRPGAGRQLSPADLPPVTVVRPLCGLETFSAETLEAAFSLDYPKFELLFCVEHEKDPIIPLAEAAIARHPEVDAQLLIGNDVISVNPKLNNMVKGWRAARHAWVVFIDSNVLTPPGFLRRCVATWRTDTGAVSAPPVGINPHDFGGVLECAFLNTYEARWQYAVDTVGRGFAQGKTLFYRKADLDRTGLRELAAEPAEDAATTKMVRRLGLRVRLAPPSPMPIGPRTFGEVWSRQLRWARLRRATFLAEFLPELIAGAAVPTLVVGLLAVAMGWPIVPALALFLLAWEGAEFALAAACGWPAGWSLAVALLLRDLLIPALWVGGLTGRSFTWKGKSLEMEQRRPARSIEPAEKSA